MRFVPFLSQLTIIFFGLCSITNADSPEGFASVTALGLTGTTGGEGGIEVTVTNAVDFLTYAQSDDTVIICVAGTIELTDMERVHSNKSIIGVDDLGVINGGGLDVFGGSNIIIRNLLFQNSMDDAIDVQHAGHHIWIDHNDLTSAHDGLVDIKHGSDYITVSWNKFYNHHKTCLLGHSDNNGAQDSTHLLVTYHHNWFDGTISRHPRVRFSGLTHVYNNYYNNNSYGIASTMDAEVLVEGNYFYTVTDPTLVGYGSSGSGDLVEQNNIFDNCTHSPETRGTVPSPPYAYVLDNAANVPEMVQNSAGRAGYVTAISLNENNASVRSYQIYQNYPNPFNPTTTIRFQTPSSGHITISIYDVAGQLLEKVLDDWVEGGIHEIQFNATHLTSGVYFYQLKVKDVLELKKMILMK